MTLPGSASPASLPACDAMQGSCLQGPNPPASQPASTSGEAPTIIDRGHWGGWGGTPGPGPAPAPTDPSQRLGALAMSMWIIEQDTAAMLWLSRPSQSNGCCCETLRLATYMNDYHSTSSYPLDTLAGTRSMSSTIQSSPVQPNAFAHFTKHCD